MDNLSRWQDGKYMQAAGKSTMKVLPDFVAMKIYIDFFATDWNEIRTEDSASINAVRELLEKTYHIDREDIINFGTVRSRRQPMPDDEDEYKDFKVKSNSTYSVRVRDFDVLPALKADLLKINHVKLSTPSIGLDRDTFKTFMKDLKQLAMDNAREKALALAELDNATIGKANLVDEYSFADKLSTQHEVNGYVLSLEVIDGKELDTTIDLECGVNVCFKLNYIN